MSDQAGQSPQEERRRERRVIFRGQCRLMIISPVWAITTHPLEGMTENITTVGLRVNDVRAQPGQPRNWLSAIRRDENLRVEVTLPELPGFPHLQGSIVWVQQAEPGEGVDLLTCSVGILFSILRDRETRALKKLVDAITSEREK